MVRSMPVALIKRHYCDDSNDTCINAYYIQKYCSLTLFFSFLDKKVTEYVTYVYAEYAQYKTPMHNIFCGKDLFMFLR